MKQSVLMKGILLICLTVSCVAGAFGQDMEAPAIPWEEATEEQKSDDIEQGIDRQCNSKVLVKSFIVKKNDSVDKSFSLMQFFMVCGDSNQMIETMVCSGELDIDELMWASPEIDIDVEFISTLKENIECP